MKFKVGDKVRIIPKRYGLSEIIWEIYRICEDSAGYDCVSYMINTEKPEHTTNALWYEEELEYAEDNIERTTDMVRTETQRKIDSWIAEKVQTKALDKYIKEQLSWYPEFSKFNDTDAFNAIETAYLEITPEEQYDPYIWTVIVERALAALEPNKNKLFKIEFKDEYDGYIKEMTVGYKWISHNLSESMESACFSLGVGDNFEPTIDFEDDESVPCKITRIN